MQHVLPLSSLRTIFASMLWIGAIAICALAPRDAYGYGVFQTLQHTETGFDCLDEVYAVALSPDGRHLYSGGDEAIMVMERDAATGALTPIQSLKAKRDGFDIYFIDHLAMSPDGLNLYMGSSTFSALAVFARDPASGLLTHVQSLFESDPDIEGLNTLFDLELSPDGGHVYTLSPPEAEIGIFARSSGDGSLTTVDIVNDNGDVPELQFPITLAVSPDGSQLVVGDRLTGLVAFERAVADGRLTLQSELSTDNLGLSRPRDAAYSPDGGQLYVSGLDNNSLSPALIGLRRSVDNDLTRFQTLSGLQTSEGLVFEADGSHLYLVDGGPITALSRSPQGQLTVIQQRDLTVGEAKGLAKNSRGVLDDQGRHLYLAGLEFISIFERQNDGRVTLLDRIFDGEGGTVDGLLDIVAQHATRDGRDLYAIGGENQVLTQFRRAENGRLQRGQIISLRDLSPSSDFERIVATPSDSHLLVMPTSSPALIFRRGDEGQLEFLNQHDFLNVFPSQLVFDPSGRVLFVGSGSDLEIVDFDPDSGAISTTFNSITGSFEMLAMDPEGRFLFGGLSQRSSGENSVLTTYRWDPDERRLTEVARRTAATFGERFTKLLITPDGRHLIATGRDSIEAGLTVLEVQQADGSLTTVQTFSPQEGHSGFEDPWLGAISPSGTRLVAIGDFSGSGVTSTLFARDPSTGLLEILEQRVPGDSSGPSSIESYGKLAWSPDGRQFYMASTISDSLYAFDERLEGAGCLPGPQALCLGNEGRFRVEVQWTDFVGWQGVGTKVVEAGDSGLFWFFDAANWEMLVKVVDGCGFNGHHWVFAAATTNVAYTLTVTDTLRGVEAIYQNSLGTSADAITDTEALDSCP